MAAHSKFPPSGSGRWSVCTASIGYIEANQHLIPKIDWSFAERGTRAHDAGAKLIKDPKASVKVDDPEMLATSSAYAEFVRGLIEPDDRVLIETKVRLFYQPSDKGTVDAALINPRRIYIADYKDGVGVGVYAKENTQLATYAESLIRELELVEEVPDSLLVTMAIYQPRDMGDPNPTRLWAISRGELRAFTHRIAAAKESIVRGEVVFKAGPHCDKSFCPVRGLCKHYGAQGLEALSDEPVDAIIASPRTLTELVSPESINRSQRQRILKAKPLLIKWLEEIENQEVHDLMSGAPPDRFKLVAGKTNRRWVDEQKAADLLGTLIDPKLVKPPVEPSVVSPAQAEKLLKGSTVTDEFKASLSALIEKPEGKPTLVPVGDNRPALLFNPTEGLSKITETDNSSLI